MRCWSWGPDDGMFRGEQDRVLGTEQRDMKPGSTQAWCVWDMRVLLGMELGDLETSRTCPITSLGRTGWGQGGAWGCWLGTSWGPQLTWDLRIRRSAEDLSSSCSMFLSMPGEIQTPVHQGPSSVCPAQPAHPVRPRGTRGAGGQRRGHTATHS